MAEIQQRLELITSQRTKRVPCEEDDGDILAAVLKPKRPNKRQSIALSCGWSLVHTQAKYP